MNRLFVSHLSLTRTTRTRHVRPSISPTANWTHQHGDGDASAVTVGIDDDDDDKSTHGDGDPVTVPVFDD
jgi:hypothetical protein